MVQLGNGGKMSNQTSNHQQKSSNVVWHESQVSRSMREELNGHAGAVLWFTGLSGAGKSTLANAVEARLHEMKVRTFVIDGDNVRHGLCADLTFSDADRIENIRRVGEVAGLFVQAGVMTLTAFISPFRADREKVRSIVGENFIEVHCNTALEVCESRDVKGLYKKARAGEISDFTGISSPYEAPENPEIRVDTGTHPLNECVDQVIAYLQSRKLIA